MRADGSLGGYGGGLDRKQWFLDHERQYGATIAATHSATASSHSHSHGGHSMSNHQDPEVAAALASDLIIDITTIGRTSGARKRLEIWYHVVDGRYYITGRPGPRSWYANVLVNPAITFHVKQSTKADLPATATAVTDPAAKRAVFLNAPKLKEFITEDSVQEWVDGSPLIEVTFGE